MNEYDDEWFMQANKGNQSQAQAQVLLTDDTNTIDLTNDAGTADLTPS
jgi:hypothetical protein